VARSLYLLIRVLYRGITKSRRVWGAAHCG
jgi:hypothetical protein